MNPSINILHLHSQIQCHCHKIIIGLIAKLMTYNKYHIVRKFGGENCEFTLLQMNRSPKGHSLNY